MNTAGHWGEVSDLPMDISFPLYVKPCFHSFCPGKGACVVCMVVALGECLPADKTPALTGTAYLLSETQPYSLSIPSLSLYTPSCLLWNPFNLPHSSSLAGSPGAAVAAATATPQ